MKYLFLCLLTVHGLIHLKGFTIAFRPAEMPHIAQMSSKPLGVLWIIATLLFILAAVLFATKKEWWFTLAFIAVIVSQFLIIGSWQNTKFGTIANAIILLVSITAYAHFRFETLAHAEVNEIFEKYIPENPPKSPQKHFEDLPPIVQKWLKNSGSDQKPRTTSIRLKQKGEMRTKPDGPWMPFTAQQYFNSVDPSFIWITKVDVMPLIYMDGRDKLNNGKGSMLIKLLALFKVVEEEDNEKINSGSLQRYLAEICWFPSAAMEGYCSWEAVGANSAKATVKLAEMTVSGIFSFSADGEFISFETQRFFGGSIDAQRETWFIEAKEYKLFEGIKIPNKCSVTWKLESGDFNWFNLEIINLEYNRNQLW